MLRQNFVVFLLFTLLGFFAYKDCFGIYIPADNYYTFYLFEKYKLHGIIESLRITEPFLVSTPLLYLFFKLFGLNSLYWIGLSVFIHIINSFLVYLICSVIQNIFLSASNKWISVFAGLLFLFSPYQTEAVLWVPTDIIILLPTCFVLLGSYYLCQFFTYKRGSYVLLLHLSFLLAVFSYESALFFPGTCFLLFCFMYYKNEYSIPLRAFALNIAFPQIGLILIYFSLCKLWYGNWIWHGETLNIGLSPVFYIGTFLKYLAKFFLLYRYLPVENIDVLLRTSYANPSVIIIIFIVAGIIAISFIYFFRNRKTVNLLGFVFMCFAFALVPVLPLDSSFLKYIYPDRYGYLPSSFFYLFLSTGIFFSFRKIALPLLLGLTILFWFLQTQTIVAWKEADDYCDRIIQDYEPFLAYDNVYILGLPSYYKGIATLRCDFPPAIYFHHNKKSIEKIHVIATMYVETPSDSLSSVFINDNKVEIIGPNRKNPFFGYYGSWAESYETEEYKVVFDPTGCSYTLIFKQEIPKNSAFVYISNGIWKKAN